LTHYLLIARDVVIDALLRVVKDVGEVATAAVLAVVHGSHEDTGTALHDELV